MAKPNEADVCWDAEPTEPTSINLLYKERSLNKLFHSPVSWIRDLHCCIHCVSLLHNRLQAGAEWRRNVLFREIFLFRLASNIFHAGLHFWKLIQFALKHEGPLAIKVPYQSLNEVSYLAMKQSATGTWWSPNDSLDGKEGSGRNRISGNKWTSASARCLLSQSGLGLKRRHASWPRVTDLWLVLTRRAWMEKAVSCRGTRALWHWHLSLRQLSDVRALIRLEQKTKHTERKSEVVLINTPPFFRRTGFSFLP